MILLQKYNHGNFRDFRDIILSSLENKCTTKGYNKATRKLRNVSLINKICVLI